VEEFYYDTENRKDFARTIIELAGEKIDESMCIAEENEVVKTENLTK
jgi:hypothetical protein